MRQPLTVTTEQLDDIAAKQQQAAEAAAAPAIKKPAHPAATEKWQVPKLPYGLDLAAAKQAAYDAASQYLNKMFAADDLAVEITGAETGTTAYIRNMLEDKIVSQYQGSDILKVYAENYKGRGVIVDGTI